MIRLSDDQVEAALYAVEQCITYHGNSRRRVPHGVTALQRILRLASSLGSENETPTPELGNDLISGTEAGEILGCSRKWVWNIRADLDGILRGGRWLYPRNAVIDYAENWERRRKAS